MSTYKEDFQLEDDLLSVRLSGKFPNERLHTSDNAFQPLIDECARRQRKKALIDATTLQVRLDTMELLRAGTDAARLARFDLRIAVIARRDMLDSLFEDVAVNRGGNVRVFTDSDIARAWLKAP